jgi:hypothetical protein
MLSNRRYLWLLLPGLLSSFIVNPWVKTPVISAIAAWAGIPLRIGLDGSIWFAALSLFNPHIFEEAIKLLPAAVPATRKMRNDASGALWAGLAQGPA